MKTSTVMLGLLLIAGCASYSGLADPESDTRQIATYAVLHEGRELLAVVSYLQADKGLGDEWLVLGAELTSARGIGPIVLKREDIWVRTPNGQRSPLISQKQYRSVYPRLRIPLERALSDLPLLYRFQPNQTPCGSWFLVDPPHNIALDEISVNNFQACSGPLIFMIPGGVQPGRWHLVIELEESRASIPFVVGPEPR